MSDTHTSDNDKVEILHRNNLARRIPNNGIVVGLEVALHDMGCVLSRFFGAPVGVSARRDVAFEGVQIMSRDQLQWGNVQGTTSKRHQYS